MCIEIFSKEYFSYINGVINKYIYKNTYENIKKDDNHNTIINMQPISNSREIGIQTDEPNEWDIICDSN